MTIARPKKTAPWSLGNELKWFSVSGANSGRYHKAESLGVQGTRMRGENKLQHPAQESRARRSDDAAQQPRTDVDIVGCEPQVPQHRDECDALQQLTDCQGLRHSVQQQRVTRDRVHRLDRSEVPALMA